MVISGFRKLFLQAETLSLRGSFHAAITGISVKRSQQCPEFLQAQLQLSSAPCLPTETIVKDTMV